MRLFRLLLLAGLLAPGFAAEPAKGTSKPTAPTPAPTPPPERERDRDLVVLDNQQTIAGRVEEDPTSDQHVLIRTPTGTLRLRKERVKTSLLGLAGRVAAVKDTDFSGLVELGRWCVAERHPSEALDAFDKAMALVRADPTLLKDLGIAVTYLRLVDEQRGPEAALPLYRWYRQLGGTDETTLRRLAALEAIAGPAPAGTMPALPTLPSTSPKPATQESVTTTPGRPKKEGIETRGWQAENEQWSNPINSKLVPLNAKDRDGAPEGIKRVLEITCGAGGKDKAVLRRQMVVSGTEKHILVFRLKNSAEIPLRVAVGVKTGDYVYFESETQTVKYGEGYKELRFNLTSKTFKSAATNWANSSPVENLDDIKELQVIFYNRDAEITAFITGMDLIAEDDL